MNTKGTVTGVTSKVQLFVSAKNLADLDLITQSDPFCQLKVKNTKNGSYILYGRTETIDNNLNPKWVKHFSLDYFFEGTQWLKFEVFDDDGSENELIGMAEIQLSHIMMAPKATFCTALVHKKLLRGTLKIKADAVCVSNDSIKIHFTGNLVSKKFYCCGYDNPYLLIERARMMTEADLREKSQAEM